MFNGTKHLLQESPPAWTHEAYRPLRGLSGGCGQTERHVSKHYFPHPSDEEANY